MLGVTFDTGALIALERGDKRMRTVLLAASEDGRSITVPAAVVTEWWRGGGGRSAQILAAVTVEPLREPLAKLAGEALAAVAGATAVDAMVMASAAQRGDLVYTSDLDDLQALREHFRAVPRLLRC